MTAPQRQTLSKRLRIAISILVVGHLLAVVLPPMSFQTAPSPSVSTAFAPFVGYSQFLYIDRGYAFFAPDPGPSHLVQAAITGRDGRRSEIMFPDRQQQWPRLLYHRHFMLTEFLDEIYQPPGPPAALVQADPEEAELWVRRRARYENMRQSVVEHLKHTHPGKDVAIRRIEHLIPSVIDFQREPIALTDPRYYIVIPDDPIEMDRAGNLIAPSGPAETIPPPEGATVEEESSDPITEGEQTKTDNADPNTRGETPATPESRAGAVEQDGGEDGSAGETGGDASEDDNGASP